MKEEDNALEGVIDDAHPEEGTEDELEPKSGSGEEEETSSDGDSRGEGSEDDGVNYEAYARVQGWSPKDKWRGNPEDWIDAKTFVERGQKFQSTLKEKNQRLEDKVREQEEAIKNFQEFTAKQLEKQKKEAVESYKRQQKEALENDDEALYDKLEEEKLKTLEEFKPKEVKKESTTPEVPDATRKFLEENRWYGEDVVLTDYAQKYCEQLARKGLSISEQLEETKRYIVETFPHKFKNLNRELPTNVAKKVSTGAAKQNLSKGTKWSDLSDTEKSLAEGQMRIFGWTKDQFLKEYDANN